MNNVLTIIDGKPLLSVFDDMNEVISTESYESIKNINELISVDDPWDDGEMEFRLIQGGYSYQVIEYSIKSIIATQTGEFVRKVVEVFGLKLFFSDDFSKMIEAL